MPWLRVIFLVTVLTTTSGYRFRCWLACTDQTSTQNDYIEQRDRCRDYAQTKAETFPNDADEKLRKAQLVSLFSKCMAQNGWTVPDGTGEGEGKKPTAGTPPMPPGGVAVSAAPMPVAPGIDEKSALIRASECAFARQSANQSSNALTRAQACDLECTQALRVAPGGPRPPSCPPEHPPHYSRGTEKH